MKNMPTAMNRRNPKYGIPFPLAMLNTALPVVADLPRIMDFFM